MSEPEQTPDPRKNELWEYKDGSGTVRVMADPIENYVLARRKGCMPFVTLLKDFHRRYVRKPMPGRG